MGGAPSLSNQGLNNMYSHDLGAISQGLAAGILSAMSGQLNGLHNSGHLSTQLSMPGGNGFSNMPSGQLGLAGSTNLGNSLVSVSISLIRSASGSLG
jgi:hypothetical protein